MRLNKILEDLPKPIKNTLLLIAGMVLVSCQDYITNSNPNIIRYDLPRSSNPNRVTIPFKVEKINEKRNGMDSQGYELYITETAPGDTTPLTLPKLFHKQEPIGRARVVVEKTFEREVDCELDSFSVLGYRIKIINTQTGEDYEIIDYTGTFSGCF